MAKETKKKTKAAALDEKKAGRKNVFSRMAAKLKKNAKPAAEKKSGARKKSADHDRPAPVKTPAKKTRGTLRRQEKKTAPAPPRDPVISAPADDVDASQAAKFALKTPETPQPKPSAQKIPEYENLGELPECYGTKKLYLAARDPHWLYAYWDLTPDQIGAAERQSHDGKVFLQVHTADGERVQQIHISPWTREWYIGAHRPDQTFYAEVGYYRHDGRFETLTRSASVTSPRAGLSWRAEARFATIPFKFSFRELAEIIRTHALPDEEVAETLARLQTTGFPLPFKTGATLNLSEESHRALLDYLGGDLTRRIRMGSDEITEIFRKNNAADHGLDLAELASGQWSSPAGGYGAERGFHAHINAELIIYGGTAPDARVRVDGREIRLNNSGAFHYHFNYKDGKYHIPVEFTSADGQETRSVLLSFLRLTEKHGEVRDTPQPPRSEPLGKVAG
ncbi:MAG: DUF4912 domain-containing protein [Verrucomicrobiales bacterium]|nr:DUF4912 domain-containing protein [Verrucomicrobiales bacterium]